MDPTPWQYQPTQAAHAAIDYDDDPPKEPTTPRDGLQIAVMWFAAGCIVTAALSAIFF